MAIRKKDALWYHEMDRPGKLEVVATKPCLTQRDLSLAYTPGVAQPCLEIQKNPLNAFKYTNRGNLVAVLTNGTAVLGLGNIGALAGKPVMEGKGVLFKRFGDIDVFDIEVNTEDPDEVIRIAKLIEPTFGGINLEDIKAPECFYIEETLKKELSIPVFHDDQHGTAIIGGAGLVNAVELTEKDIDRARMVIVGAGASGIACAKIFVQLGIKKENIIMIDSKGVIYRGRSEGMNPYKEEFATEESCRTLEEAMEGAEIFIGLSKPNLISEKMLKSMGPKPIIFALANPDPEVNPILAKRVRPDAIVATGRSDYANQINNVLGFPFIFRGALDVRATAINEEMKIAASHALAKLAKEDVPDSVIQAYGGVTIRFGPDYIIPKPLDPRMLIWEACAVAQAAMESGVAQKQIDLNAYRQQLENRLGRSYEVIRVVINKAKSEPKRIVYPEGEEEKVLRATHIVIDEKIAHPILLGDEKIILKKAKMLGLELEKAQIINPLKSKLFNQYCEDYYRMRQRYGITRESVEKLIRLPHYFGTMMVSCEDADGFVGVNQNFHEEILPAQQVIPQKNPGGKVATLYILVFKKKVYFLADTHGNIDPTSEELAEIAIQSAKIVRLFDMEPRIAMLSFSNFGSVDHPHTRKIQKAVEIVLKREPDLMIDGEMQGDTAVVPEIIEEIFPFSRLKNGANVLIFPELQSGNITMNLLKRLGGAESIGPIQIGLVNSIHVIRKTATVEEIVRLTAIAVVDAQKWLL
ncbi:NADP-dependent malic enzyme [bacterium]|nr:NADP-dependent malic enzyme [bacterium]RQV95893.1 MAG: NADP-dependent malic enzyme [bacterium]